MTAVLTTLSLALVGAVGISTPASAFSPQTVNVQPGSTKIIETGGSGTVGSASLNYSLPKLPTAGGGLYTGVRVRSNTAGAYVLASRVASDGNVHVSLKKSTRSGAAETVVMLGDVQVAPAKATAGAPIAVNLKISGTTNAVLEGSVTVAGKTVTVSATDSTNPLLTGGGADSTFYVSSSTPALSAVLHSASASLSTPSKPVPSSDRNASNTGVPAGVNLRVHQGDITVTQANTVIDGLEVHGVITINAPGVVIRNTRVVGGTVPGRAGLVQNVVSGQPFTIVDSELVAKTPSPYWNGIMGSNFTAERVNIHGVVDPVRVLGGNVVVRNSWLHDNSYWANDPLWNGGASHSDSVQIQAGTNIVLEGNRMEGSNNAAIQITQDTSRAQLGTIRIADNYLQGGACTVNIARTPAFVQTSIVGNVFGPARQYGHCAVLAPASNAPQLASNIWGATGSPMTAYTVLK